MSFFTEIPWLVISLKKKLWTSLGGEKLRKTIILAAELKILSGIFSETTTKSSSSNSL